MEVKNLRALLLVVHITGQLTLEQMIMDLIFIRVDIEIPAVAQVVQQLTLPSGLQHNTMTGNLFTVQTPFIGVQA